jgi:hypothetical protein
METSFNQEQVTILVKTLIDAINSKNEEIELSESYANMLGDVIDQLNDEITSLKAKAKAKTPKVTKAPKVTTEPDLPIVKSIKMVRGLPKKVAIEPPVKRKPGRPKKVVG